MSAHGHAYVDSSTSFWMDGLNRPAFRYQADVSDPKGQEGSFDIKVKDPPTRVTIFCGGAEEADALAAELERVSGEMRDHADKIRRAQAVPS